MRTLPVGRLDLPFRKAVLVQTSVVDIRALAASLEKTLPFVLLLLLLFILRHLVGLAAFSWLTYLLYRLNKVVRSQVALKAQRQPGPLLTAAGLVTLQVGQLGVPKGSCCEEAGLPVRRSRLCRQVAHHVREREHQAAV